MTLRETIRIAKEYGFKKVTVLKQDSGCDDVFHYFNTRSNGVDLMIYLDELKNQWVLDINMGDTYFYNFESVVNIIHAITNGK